MSDAPGPVVLEANGTNRTFTIPANPTHANVMQLMDQVSRFLTEVVGVLLAQEKGNRPTFPPVHPASNSLFQAAQVLQNGCAQLEMLASQQQGFIGPGQAGPRRMN